MFAFVSIWIFVAWKNNETHNGCIISYWIEIGNEVPQHSNDTSLTRMHTSQKYKNMKHKWKNGIKILIRSTPWHYYYYFQYILIYVSIFKWKKSEKHVRMNRDHCLNSSQSTLAFRWWETATESGSEGDFYGILDYW